MGAFWEGLADECAWGVFVNKCVFAQIDQMPSKREQRTFFW